ncbi:MAG: hypothetical protein V4621_07640 [Pseudomonadota bacterium]
MSFLWGKKFTDQWGGILAGKDSEEVKRNASKMQDVWLKSLADISELEFRRGATKMQNLAWPPTLPEFLKLCRPDVNPLNAYYEAVEGSRSRERGEIGTWSHPAIFWASVRVTAFELASQSYSQIKTRWEAALALELAKQEWPPIEAPKIALPAPPKATISKEKAAELMQQIKSVGNIQASPGRDSKRWAKVIMERYSAGDNKLTPIQVKFAREALDMRDDENE